jgi:hypothetical protein
MKDAPLTDPPALASSMLFHLVLLGLASLVALRVVMTPGPSGPTALRASLKAIDNRVPPALDGGGGPGEDGGLGPDDASRSVTLKGPSPSSASSSLRAAINGARASSLGPNDLDLEPLPGSGVGVRPGPGLGGGGGAGGGSGGGSGPGVGPATEFFGTRAEGSSFVYVIDRSGSMSAQDRLGLAKAELMASLDQLAPDARFRVLFYNLDPIEVPGPDGRPGPREATTAAKVDVRRRLAEFDARGGTDHVRALRLALSGHPDIIFFLTDARQMTPEQAEELQALAGATRIVAVEFGTGPDPGSPDPLRSLALATGGTFRYVDVLRFVRPSRPNLPGADEYESRP